MPRSTARVNRDDILFGRAGASRAGYFSNFARTRHQGVDLGAHGQWGAWRASADYSYLRATYDADGTLFTGARTVTVRPGTPIAGLPRHTLKLGLDWDLRPGLVLGADHAGGVACGEPGQRGWADRGRRGR